MIAPTQHRPRPGSRAAWRRRRPTSARGGTARRPRGPAPTREAKRTPSTSVVASVRVAGVEHGEGVGEVATAGSSAATRVAGGRRGLDVVPAHVRQARDALAAASTRPGRKPKHVASFSSERSNSSCRPTQTPSRCAPSSTASRIASLQPAAAQLVHGRPGGALPGHHQPRAPRATRAGVVAEHRCGAGALERRAQRAHVARRRSRPARPRAARSQHALRGGRRRRRGGGRARTPRAARGPAP